jgi:hypothetical protein
MTLSLVVLDYLHRSRDLESTTAGLLVLIIHILSNKKIYTTLKRLPGHIRLIF